jgi:hypothetical protein
VSALPQAVEQAVEIIPAPPAPTVAPAPKPVAVAKPAPAAALKPESLTDDARAQRFFDYTTGRVVG